MVVPHFSELAANKIQVLVADNPLFTEYLPDLQFMKKALQRQYIYNVRAITLHPPPLSIDCEHH